MVNKKYLIFAFVLLLLPLAFAHEGEDDQEFIQGMTAEEISQLSMMVLAVCAVLVTIFVILAIIHRPESKILKLAIFLGIVIPTVIATLFLTGATIYKNTISDTGGPVHWHADFEIWDCDESLDLIDPTGLSNKVGTSVYHEHNDFRVHVEGTVIRRADVDLHNFFEVIGGAMTKDYVIIPTNDETVNRRNGDLCNGEPGTWQVFLYKTEGDTFTQEKLTEYPDYVISPESFVPPGDCLILEFGPEKEKTDRICETYSIAIDKGEVHGG